MPASCMPLLTVPVCSCVSIELHPQLRSFLSAGNATQAAISQRMASFPAAIQGHMHHARCLLPAAAAHILQTDLQLVSSAVAAWCNRGPKGLQQASRLQYIPPQPQVPGQ